jgi:hypothetical protein
MSQAKAKMIQAKAKMIQAKAKMTGAKAPKPKAAAAKFNCDPSDVMQTCRNTRGFPETERRYRFPIFK